MLYAVFVKDFKGAPAHHCGTRVHYNDRILPDGQGKEEGFWHVITKDEGVGGNRIPDYQRAKRLPWARPVMESGERAEIKVFDYDHGTKDKGVRRYIWLFDLDYVLVLWRRKARYFWLTAYHVDSTRRREDLNSRFLNKL
jgi:hypothetical protein